MKGLVESVFCDHLVFFQRQKRGVWLFVKFIWVSLGVKLSGRTDRVVTATNTVTTGYSCLHRIR